MDNEQNTTKPNGIDNKKDDRSEATVLPKESTNKAVGTTPQRSADNPDQGVQTNNPKIDNAAKKPETTLLTKFLRFLVIGGGMLVVFIIGFGVSFSTCFTIKGPPPPECGPVSFVSVVLMPIAALFILIPLARKIK